jgi:hypothetical protein
VEQQERAMKQQAAKAEMVNASSLMLNKYHY